MVGTKPFFTSIDPDVLEQEVGGGGLILVSLPFWAVGVFTVLSSLQRLPWDMQNGPTSWIGVGCGGFLCLLALVIMTARSGLRIDRRQGKVVKWNRVIVPFKVKEYPLDRYELIRVDFQAGDHDTATLYPLSLAGTGVTEPLVIHRSADYPEIRRLSEELSRFLGKPVEDNSLGTKIIRESGLLNESFRDRVKRTKASFDVLPAPPAVTSTKLTETGNGLVLEIPAAPFPQLYLIPAVFGCLFALFFGMSFLPRLFALTGPPAVKYGFIVAAVLLVIFLPILSAVSVYRRKSRECVLVTVSRAFLRVEEKAGGKMKTTEIPADEIEDLVLPEPKALGIQEEGRVADKKVMVSFDRGDNKAIPLRGAIPQSVLSFIVKLASPGITIRSDKATLTGKGLPQEELTWIYHLIAKTVTGD